MIWEKLLFWKKTKKFRDWDVSYQEGDTPWDSGEASLELIDVLKTQKVRPPGKALELGCGTGTNSIYMAQEGFEVVAIDISGAALEVARHKAEKAGGGVQFIRAKLPGIDLVENGISEKKFDFIFDRGCFHTMSLEQRASYANLVFRLLKKEGLFLVLTGNAREPSNAGPPVLTEGEIRGVFGRQFNVIEIREFRFYSKGGVPGALGYSCLMGKR